MITSRTKVKKIPKRLMNRLEKIEKSLNGPGKVKVGFPEGSNDYPDGTSVVMVAAVHEFGSGPVPERSFLRSTMFEKRRHYLRQIQKYGKEIIAGKMTLEKALNLLGLEAQRDVRQKINDIKDPPLVYREGNPLHDTGHMIESVDYQIRKE